MQQQNYYRYVALGIILIIGLGDILDGYLARKRGEVTKLGKYLDPIADKLVLVITCVLLSSDRFWPEPRFPDWIPAVIISRELFISLGIIAVIIIPKRKIEFSPSKLGRLSTFLQITAIAAVLLGNHLSLTILVVLWWLVAVAVIASTLNYTYKSVKQFWVN